MSLKPSLTRALHVAADITRQTLRDPGVRHAAADVLEQAGRKLADKADRGALKLRARAGGTAEEPAPGLGRATRRVGTALADAMRRSSIAQERANRPDAPTVTPTPSDGIAAQILREAGDTYKRVHAKFDGYIAEARAAEAAAEAAQAVAAAAEDALAATPDDVEPAVVHEADAAATQPSGGAAAEKEKAEAPAEALRAEVSADALPAEAPEQTPVEADADGRELQALLAKAGGMAASAIGAPGPGSDPAPSGDAAELPGHSRWTPEGRAVRE